MALSTHSFLIATFMLFPISKRTQTEVMEKCGQLKKTKAFVGKQIILHNNCLDRTMPPGLFMDWTRLCMEIVNMIGLFSNRIIRDLYIHYGGKFSVLLYGRNHIWHYQFDFRGNCSLHLLLWRQYKAIIYSLIVGLSLGHINISGLLYY